MPQYALDLPTNPSQTLTQSAVDRFPSHFSAGEKGKARELLAAIRIVNQLEHEKRRATPEERQQLARFGGFGAVALSLFPHAVTGKYKDAGWEVLGNELQSLLSPADYESAKRTTFNAFYTSPIVMQAMHDALRQLGVAENALVLEPGCGVGNFMQHAPSNMRFIGVELDKTTGRIARALHPQQDIRIESFQDTKLPGEKLDAVIGNVPFANITLPYRGEKFSLHDYFFAKSVDALKPGGVLALVTSRFTLDKQNASLREFVASRADFLGAIRLPSDAFKNEGTKVVTDIVLLRKRAPGVEANHATPDWLKTENILVDGAEIPINAYYLKHPEMILGQMERENTLYGGEGISIKGTGDLKQQLAQAIAKLPRFETLSPDISKTDQAIAFVPPPPDKHIGEGSFFVGEDRAIYQIEGGQAVAVVYSGTALKADGTMTGKRLAALIGLRDLARRVLQSQNEAWPEKHRHKARDDLNGAYDRFTSLYGPINKTTFSETSDGKTTRRMPNLAKFREDPDAMLVMSLEEYDDIEQTASKAAIMKQDVVGKVPPVTQVTSAEEGLLVSLDRRGEIDLELISVLYGKSKSEIIDELGDLIYFDPACKRWETSDAYLSGNVREKLAIAERFGNRFDRNVLALREVQPPDVLPGDIDARLGAPWIGEEDIAAFAAEIFAGKKGSIRVAHLPKDAVWSVDADYSAENSVAASTDYGTSRINGVRLLELVLNLKPPTIYDQHYIDGNEVRVINQEETLGAREKQRLIKERFKEWIFSDPERTERLVRVYNDRYNNLRPRLFDGSHLQFPGMNPAIHLRQHQKDAIWRGMSSGNTLLAHAVGAGKTFTMAATGMKMKQAGLIQKPLYVVPNHMLEQFSREFMQLYPNAQLLIATKDDLSKERRKFLTAKIASGQWDGIIVTHSSFERIGMSRDYQEKFLREQIAEYDKLIFDPKADNSGKARRNLIKTIEKQKAQRELRLKDLLAKEKKDDGLVFDELGIDQIFVDEAHYFKNLETPSKMERVAGVQTGGSERAFDLYMKCRYLDELHPGRVAVFATGTPISNTMVEMYTLERFLDPRGLISRGIEHFDAWAATFGEVIDSMEISPDGASLRPRSRFAKFTNLPELQQMFRAFADVQTAEMLDLPRPRLRDNKPTIVACPMSEAQQVIQQKLVERYERIRSERVDPREDNALAITTDGRKLALDARMLDADARSEVDSKLERLIDNVARIWKESTDVRGAQMIFCDLGVKPTQWGFSVYDEVVEGLVKAGIPRQQIAAIGEADTDAKKQSLFEKVRQGSVRILLGSTQKMGTGTNVQKRLIALHHLDAPWKPAEVEQREGRILRQGNANPEVQIYRYVTEGSFDAYMWQALETKAKFINQIITGDATARSAEDIGDQELSYAEVKAIASGNPAVLTLAEADAELKRLSILKKNHTDEQFLARRSLRELPEKISALKKSLEALRADQLTLNERAGDSFMLEGKRLSRDDLLIRLGKRLESLPLSRSGKVPLGGYCGLEAGLTFLADQPVELYLQGQTLRTARFSRDLPGPRALLNAMERLAAGYGEQIEKAQRDLALCESQLKDYGERIGKKFEFETYVSELEALRDALKVKLANPASPQQEDPSPTAAKISEQIKERMAAHQIESAPKRIQAQRGVIAERPVAARVKRNEATYNEERTVAVEEVRRPVIVLEPAESPFSLKQEAPSQGFTFEEKVAATRRAERKQRELF